MGVVFLCINQVAQKQSLLDSHTERKVLRLNHIIWLESQRQRRLPADRCVVKGEDIARLRLARRRILPRFKGEISQALEE